MTPYRAVLSLPGVAALEAVAVLARMPQLALGIVLVLHVVETLGRGYGEAALVAAVATVGAAVSGPWRGRAVDRVGLRRALVPSVLAQGAVWGVAPWLDYPMLLVAAAVGGLLALPVFPVVRQSLTVLVPAGQRRTAFALDSVGVELSFVLGPALATVLVVRASSGATLLAVGAASVLSGLLLMALDPPVTAAAAARRRGAAGGGAAGGGAGGEAVSAAAPVPGHEPLPGVPPTLALALGLGCAAVVSVVLGATDVALVAVLREQGESGWIAAALALWAAGSVVGGLVYGVLPRGASPAVLLAGLGLLTAPVGLAGTPLLLCAALFGAGLLCAPAISATVEAVSSAAAEERRGQLMGWHGSAITVGTAVGAPLAGFAIDAAGGWAGFAAAGAVGALAGAGGVLLARSRRGRG
ncbi:MFS transporter [Kineococcus xinjiangensis]|uniref:MFS transporter n=1 Tax=Kineococcus xinjiangensis TaxID=512762 RepID=UPI003CCBC7EF